MGGEVEYNDVRLIDLRDRGVLWEGEVEHRQEEKVRLSGCHAYYALEASKEANNELCRKIEECLVELSMSVEAVQSPPVSAPGGAVSARAGAAAAATLRPVA